jgi:RNA polymerase sigma-70 factor (ECF subfamily)
MFFKRSQQPLTEPCGFGCADLARLSDEAVMHHLAFGHDDALAILYDRYARLVMSIALKIVRDEGEAQDVKQEVFMNLYRTVAQFDASKGTTKMWILRFTYQRSINRRRYLEIRNAYGPEVDLADAERTLVPTCARMLPAESRELVRQLLEELGGQQRRTLELAYFEGLTMEEIAQKTGESVGNIRHQYYRGLAKLRVRLAERSVVTMKRSMEIADASA